MCSNLVYYDLSFEMQLASTWTSFLMSYHTVVDYNNELYDVNMLYFSNVRTIVVVMCRGQYAYFYNIN